MTDKLPAIIELLISVGGISAVLFIVNQQVKTQANKTIMGMDITTINRIGYLGIAIFVGLFVVEMMK